MRLTEKQVEGITTTLSEFTNGHAAELYLFGSRARDDLKGGDIDLLLLLDNEAFKKELHNQKHLILSKIKSKIGDQRIDLKIALKQDIDTDPFLKLIVPQALLLKTWP